MNYPNDCTVVYFKVLNEIVDCDDYKDLIEDIKTKCIKIVPDLLPSTNFLGPVNQVLLENDKCYIGISDYVDSAYLWLKHKNDIQYGLSVSEGILQVFEKC
jgi:hypothetical protein